MGNGGRQILLPAAGSGGACMLGAGTMTGAADDCCHGGYSASTLESALCRVGTCGEDGCPSFGATN